MGALLPAVPLQRCPTSCLELRCSYKWPNSREYTWSTSSRNPVTFLVLKEMSSQKIYLQDYITVCSNSVYILSLHISIISFRASLTEQVLPYIPNREVADCIYCYFALIRQYYILMAFPSAIWI